MHAKNYWLSERDAELFCFENERVSLESKFIKYFISTLVQGIHRAFEDYYNVFASMALHNDLVFTKPGIAWLVAWASVCERAAVNHSNSCDVIWNVFDAVEYLISSITKKGNNGIRNFI